MPIHYLDALAGAGKTRALVVYADQRARSGHKVLFLQPTKLLIEQTVADELAKLHPDYPVTRIHGDLSNGVVGKLVAHFQETGFGGEIVFATHAAFFRVPYLHRRSEWTLLCDEIPQVDLFEELNLAETHHLITPHIKLEPRGPIYGVLVGKEGDR